MRAEFSSGNSKKSCAGATDVQSESIESRPLFRVSPPAKAGMFTDRGKYLNEEICSGLAQTGSKWIVEG